MSETAVLIFAVVLVATQRLLELVLARRNERKTRVKGAVERGREYYPFIVALHSLWLVSTLVEGILRGPEFPTVWPVPLALFLLVQPLRYWAIFSLGESWNTKILVVPGATLVRRGPYRYLNHPNFAPHFRSVGYGVRLHGPERDPPLHKDPGGESSVYGAFRPWSNCKTVNSIREVSKSKADR